MRGKNYENETYKAYIYKSLLIKTTMRKKIDIKQLKKEPLVGMDYGD